MGVYLTQYLVMLAKLCIIAAPNLSLVRSHNGSDATLESSCLCKQQAGSLVFATKPDMLQISV